MNITIIKKISWQTWAFLIISILLVIGLYKGCQNSLYRLAENAANKAAYDSLMAQIRQDSINRFASNQMFIDRINRAQEKREEQEHLTDSMSKLLTGSQKRIKQLLNERIGILEGPMDEEKKDANCDSAFALLPILDAQIDGYKSETQQLNGLLKYETGIHKARIDELGRDIDSLQAKTTRLSQIADKAIKASVPRNKIFLTGTILSDLTHVGAGGGFTLLTKTEKVWGAKVGVFNKQLFYQADFGLKLSFRKKTR